MATGSTRLGTVIRSGVLAGLLIAAGGAVGAGTTATPLALAAADFDSDGTPDLASGRDDGSIEIRLGNPRSIYPFLPGSASAPFSDVSVTLHVAARVDRLVAGDFDADGHADLVAAGLGGSQLYLLAGDGAGRFAEPAKIVFPGRLTAMAAGEINRRDGLIDLALATSDDDRSALLVVYQSPRGALREEPELVDLPESASRLAIGRFDADPHPDVALASGDRVLVLHGRDRKLDHEPARRGPVGPAVLVESAIGDAVEALENSATSFAELRMRLDADALEDRVFLDVAVGEPRFATTLATTTTFVVTNTANGGPGSLRQAILDANAIAGPDRIDFDIPGAGPHTIQPLSALPAVTEPITIDATTQPGYAGTPLVEIDGQLAGPVSGVVVLSGASTIRGLAINRFEDAGIRLDTGGGNIVEGCHIGTDPAGATARGNSRGIQVRTTSNVIGGTSSPASNVVSANTIGVELLGSDNRVEGNRIGTDLAGEVALPNNTGVWVARDFNTIGGTASGAGNLISGNSSSGIAIVGNDTRVQANRIGTNTAGTAALANSVGVEIFDGSRTIIGGTTPSATNLLSGNRSPAASGYGVLIVPTGPASASRIQGNLIGTDLAGTSAIPNDAGVLINGPSTDDLIGGSLLGGGNLVSGNAASGIAVAAGVRTTIQGNLVGVDVNGTTALPNSFRGISVFDGAVDVRIGGSSLESANLVSGNAYGIAVVETIVGAPVGTRILGNVIGTDISGALALGNTEVGIDVDGAEDTTIGGDAGERNVVSASGNCGILIRGAPTVGTTVVGNYVGTDVGGSVPLGNRFGICLSGDAAGHTVGGPGAGNVVAASTISGINIGAGCSNNTIRSNLVGLDSTGVAPMPNAIGVNVTGFSNTIENNVIAGSTTSGISLSGQGASNNTIVGNTIGETVLGTPAGNERGIWIAEGADNVISSNRIAHSMGPGVLVSSGAGNRISLNSIFENGEQGIALDPPGVDVNDPLDVDEGANQRQNYPELTSASFCDVMLTVDGTLGSAASRSYDVELFFNRSCDAPLAYGEGETPLGSRMVTTDGAGDGAFAFSDLWLYPAGSTPVITATATDEVGNTSEFSGCLPVTDGRPGAVSGVAWPSKQEMEWSPEAGATGYRAYRGAPAQLPDLLTPAIDSLLAWTGTTTTTGPFFVGDPPVGEFDWYLVRATSACGEGSPGLASAGVRTHDSGGTVSTCDHGKCVTDGPLVATCDPCVNLICATDTFCCDTQWDPFCVQEVRTICGSLTCDESSGSCAHPVCATGAALTAGCDTPPLTDSCVDAVCAVDSFCCTESWDALCVSEVPLFCDANCD